MVLATNMLTVYCGLDFVWFGPSPLFVIKVLISISQRPDFIWVGPSFVIKILISSTLSWANHMPGIPWNQRIKSWWAPRCPWDGMTQPWLGQFIPVSVVSGSLELHWDQDFPQMKQSNHLTDDIKLTLNRDMQKPYTQWQEARFLIWVSSSWSVHRDDHEINSLDQNQLTCSCQWPFPIVSCEGWNWHSSFNHSRQAEHK